MKIFFIQDALINAGTEKSNLEIISKLSPKVTPVVLYFYSRHDLLELFQKEKVRVIFLDLKGKYDFVRGVFKLWRLVKKEQPDLMISSLMRSNLMSRTVSFFSRTPLIGTLVNDSYNPFRIEEHKGKGYWKFKLFWLFDKWTSSIPVHWISNASSLVEPHRITLGIDPSKVSVVYRGRTIPTASIRNQPSSVRFVAYGRLLKRKGFMEIIESVYIVRKKFPSVSLDIFGEGQFRKYLEKKIKELQLEEHVHLRGTISNPQAELAHYGSFLFPSWYEGFSGALVEAMMAGIPIIASDIPMNLEAVQDKETALVFPVKNVDALADKMVYAIEHPEEMAEMGKRAREEAIKRFDINLIARQYEEVLWNVYHRHAKKA